MSACIISDAISPTDLCKKSRLFQHADANIICGFGGSEHPDTFSSQRCHLKCVQRSQLMGCRLVTNQWKEKQQGTIIKTPNFLLKFRNVLRSSRFQTALSFKCRDWLMTPSLQKWRVLMYRKHSCLMTEEGPHKQSKSENNLLLRKQKCDLQHNMQTPEDFLRAPLEASAQMIR